MIFENIAIEGPKLVKLNCIHDERGFFARQFCIEEFINEGLEYKIEQINTSFC